MSTNITPQQQQKINQFKGFMPGMLAANSATFGPMGATTEIVNQHGGSVFYNADGTVSVVNTGAGINNWYSQSTDTLFNFAGQANNLSSGNYNLNGYANDATTTTVTTPDGTTVTVSSGSGSVSGNSGSIYNQPQTGYSAQPTFGGQYGTYSTIPNTSYAQPGTQTYQWGNSYIPVYNPIMTGTNPVYDQNGEQQELDAADLQSLVDAGVYESLAEAYDALGSKFAISDEEQAKLGLYSEEDEKKIATMMNTLGLTRKEAIAQLGDKVERADGSDSASKTDKGADDEDAEVDDSRKTYEALIAQGKTPEEALQAMEDSGTEITQDLIDEYELSKYKPEDQETLKTLLANPDNEDKTVAELAEQLKLEKTKKGEKMKTFEATESKEDSEIDEEQMEEINDVAFENFKKYAEKIGVNVDDIESIDEIADKLDPDDMNKALAEMKDMEAAIPQALVDQFELSKYSEEDRAEIKDYAEMHEISIPEAIEVLQDKGKIDVTKGNADKDTQDTTYDPTPYEDINPETGAVKAEPKEDDK